MSVDDDIQVLQLENKALRSMNQVLRDELVILRRFRKLVARSAEIVANVPMVQRQGHFVRVTGLESIFPECETVAVGKPIEDDEPFSPVAP